MKFYDDLVTYSLYETVNTFSGKDKMSQQMSQFLVQESSTYTGTMQQFVSS